jgi:uncharacterized protein YkwD
VSENGEIPPAATDSRAEFRRNIAPPSNSVCPSGTRHLPSTPPARTTGTFAAFFAFVIFRHLLLFTILLTTAAHADSVAHQVLDEINFARAKPQQYAKIVASRTGNFRSSTGSRAVREAISFLEKARPLPPLSWSPGISQAALSHALDVGRRGSNGHTSPNGDTPWKRMERFGKWQGHAGENIDYGNNSARSIVVSLIVDNGVPSRMHRKNLFSRNFRVTGIAISSHARAGTICVMDFATGFVEAGDERVATETRTGFRSEYSGMSFF